MNEIAPNAAPGWHHDSTGLLRWWDGNQWGVYAPQPIVAAPIRAQKDTGIAYLLLLLLGGFGAHHFYLGNIKTGVAVMVLWWGGWATTVVGIGFFVIAAVILWFIVDLFSMPSYVRDANSRPRTV